MGEGIWDKQSLSHTNNSKYLEYSNQIYTDKYIYIYIRMNSKMITNENEGSLIYPCRGALNQ